MSTMRSAYSGEDIEINDETGLPVLPEGFVWKYVKGGSLSEYHDLRLLKRRSFFGITYYKQVREHPVKKNVRTAKVSEEILNAAMYILFKYGPTGETADNDHTAYFGTYPPNSIKKDS